MEEKISTTSARNLEYDFKIKHLVGQQEGVRAGQDGKLKVKTDQIQSIRDKIGQIRSQNSALQISQDNIQSDNLILHNQNVKLT